MDGQAADVFEPSLAWSSMHVTGTNPVPTTAQKFAQFCKSGRKKRSRM
jgi:hypothetical protein